MGVCVSNAQPANRPGEISGTGGADTMVSLIILYNTVLYLVQADLHPKYSIVCELRISQPRISITVWILIRFLPCFVVCECY